MTQSTLSGAKVQRVRPAGPRARATCTAPPAQCRARLSDEELMAATAHHDRLAFDELHRRYGSYVTNFVRRKLSDDEQVDDVVQEVFLRLYRSASHFDPARQLRRWLFVIATNEVRRQWSRNNRAPLSLGRLLNDEDEPLEYESVLADPHPGPYELALAGLVSNKLRMAIDTLPDYQRTTLILRAYGELSLQQIAERMGCPVSTVNSRLFYAAEKIRRMMADASFGAGAAEIAEG